MKIKIVNCKHGQPKYLCKECSRQQTQLTYNFVTKNIETFIKLHDMVKECDRYTETELPGINPDDKDEPSHIHLPTGGSIKIIVED